MRIPELIEVGNQVLPILLSINNYYYRRGGAEIIFLEQNRFFEDIGWEVVPFCMKHPNNLDTPWTKYFINEIEFGEKYSIFAKALRIPKVIYSLEARRKLNHLLSIKQPDFCHIHNIYHHISPSILSVLKKHNIPTVLTLHDLKIACPNYQMLTHDGICERCKNGNLYQVIQHRCIKNSLSLSTVIFLESSIHRWLESYSRNVDRFVVPSHFYLNKLVEWGWRREQFVYIPNFVHLESLQPDFSVGKAFLYFGRLAPEKGLATLIKAAAIAKVPVWIAGTGPEEAKLHDLIDQTGADVKLLGYLTGEALHNTVRSARAVVLPSEWYENAPVSIMESYALGTSVLGAAIGGIPELIREGETGATFQSANVESLAMMLRQFADFPNQQLSNMARAGHQWMEQEFSPKTYRLKLLDLYKSLGVKG